MNAVLMPADVDRLIEQCLATAPGGGDEAQQLLIETATEMAVELLADALAARQRPSLLQIEQAITQELAYDSVPPWLARARVVLVLRDALGDPVFRKQLSRLNGTARRELIAEWADMAADLYNTFPDQQIAGRPDIAVRVLAGPSKALRKALDERIGSAPQRASAAAFLKRPLFKGLSGMMKSSPKRATFNARDDAGNTGRFNPARGIKRPSGAPRHDRPGDARTTPPRLAPARSPLPGPGSEHERPPAMPPAPQRHREESGDRAERTARAPVRPNKPHPKAQKDAPKMLRKRSPAPRPPAREPAPRMEPLASAAPAQTVYPPEPAPAEAIAPRAPAAAPATTAEKPKAPRRSRGLRQFEETIAERFSARGLAPVAVTAAAAAAISMARKACEGEAPDFFEVEYDVLVQSGDAIAPGAVRTWTLHAFMECMRDEWFREQFNGLPSPVRAEAVWTWAKAAADWFDVPEKLRDFWVRALSGGDPVLAAAAGRAFAAHQPRLPARPRNLHAQALPPGYNPATAQGILDDQYHQPRIANAPGAGSHATDTSVSEERAYSTDAYEEESGPALHHPPQRYGLHDSGPQARPAEAGGPMQNGPSRLPPRRGGMNSALIGPRPLPPRSSSAMGGAVGAAHAVPGMLPLGAAQIQFGMPAPVPWPGAQGTGTTVE